MNDVNWWLMALAFVLGLALTLALMIRRVTREVPVSESFGVRGPDVGGGRKRSGQAGAPTVDGGRWRRPWDGPVIQLHRQGGGHRCSDEQDARGPRPVGDEATTRMPRTTKA